MSDLMLDVDQASELKAAFRRGDWTNAEIKSLSEGDILKQVRDVVRRRAEIKPVEYLIDCSVAPFIPSGWSVLPDNEQLPNRIQGALKFDPTNLKLHLGKGQRGKKLLVGNKLKVALGKKQVLMANVLDYLLKPENQHLIPKEWKTLCVFFWGTIYRYSDGYLCVRYLCWRGVGWYWSYSWLTSGWDAGSPALVLAS